MNCFDRDYEWSLNAQKYQDEVYKQVFPIKTINRTEREDNNILDRIFHIDTTLELKNGIRLNGQEKALRKMYSNFNTFTIEFYQNRFTKEPGEFFNLCSQFYLHGYLNGDKPQEVTEWIKWYLIKVFDFMEWLKNKPIEELELTTKRSSGNASFFHINYNKIPKDFIYKYYIKQTDSNICLF